MTNNKRDFIEKKIQEIDEKLKDFLLNEEEKQLLLQQRAEYKEQSQEIDFNAFTDESVDDNNEFIDNNESIDEDDDDDEDTEYISLYFKYWFDDCKTIDEVLFSIDRLKQQFEEWKSEGHELTQPVDTGYCFIDKVFK
jgi:hypothetical protein